MSNDRTDTILLTITFIVVLLAAIFACVHIIKLKQTINTLRNETSIQHKEIITLEMQNEELGSEVIDLRKHKEKFDMYYYETFLTDFHYTSGVLGLAYGDFVVVWTKDVEYSEGLLTFNHEWMHNEENMIHPKEE